MHTSRRCHLRTWLAAGTLVGGTGLAAAPLAAQYPLVPSPVFDLSRLTATPTLGGYLGVRQTLRGDTATFTVSRARITAVSRPTAFLAVRIQGDLAGIGKTTSSGSVPAFSLTDAYAELVPTDGRLAQLLRPSLIVGQFKMPFSLEYLTPYSHLLTINRSQAVDNLSLKRDIGAMVQLHVSRFVTVAGAVANGSGSNATSNPNDREVASGRVTIMPLRQLAIGGKWAGEGADHRWGYDARLLIDHATVEGEVVRRSRPVGTATSDASGGYALASYALLPWLQPLVKWEQFHTTTRAGGTGAVAAETRSTWTTYGVNVVAPRDRVRLQLDWIVTSDHPVGHANAFLAQLLAIY